MTIDALNANKQLVRLLYEQRFNAGDVDLVDQLVSPDVITHNPIILDAPTGPNSIRGGIEMLRRSFLDLHVEVLDLIAEGDRVAAFLRMSGTNAGAYRRGGATKRRGSMPAFFMWRMAEGRLVESWGVADRFELLKSLESSPRRMSSPRRCPGPKDLTNGC